MGELLPLGAVSLLAGREGLGKSTLWAHWAALTTTGQLPGSDVDGPAGVIIVANEDAREYTIAPRLKAAGADLDLVFFADAVDEIGSVGSVTVPIDGQRIIDAAGTQDAKLIIIDPLVSILDGKLDSHKDHSIRRALDPLNRVAELTGASVVGLVHLNKGAGTDVLDRVLGSRAFVAAARSVVAMMPDNEDDTDTRRLVVHAKSNLGRLQARASVVEIRSQTVETSEGTAEVGTIKVLGFREVYLPDLMTPVGEDHLDNLSECAKWLLGYLADAGGAAAREDVHSDGKKLDYSREQLRQAAKRSKIRIERTSTFPSSSVWYHPNDQSTQLTQSTGARELPGSSAD